MHRGVDPFGAEVHGSHRRWRGDLGGLRRQALGLGGGAADHEAGPPEHGLLVPEGEAPVPLVLVVEPVGEIEQDRGVQGQALGTGNRHVEVLAGVRHLHEQLPVDERRVEVGGSQFLVDLEVQLPHQAPQAVEVHAGQRGDVGADDVDHVVGDEQAQGREGGGRPRDQDPVHTQLGGDRRGVHGTVAAVGDEGQLPGIGAVAGQDPAGGVGHVGVDDALDAPGGLGHIEAEGRGHLPLDCVPGGVDVEVHAPAGEPGGGQVPEYGVGIGHRGLVTTPAVAGRAGRGAGALRADQKSALAHAGDGATTGADTLHVDHREPDVVPVPPVPVGLDLGAAAPDQADVEAGAAHVDGDEVGFAAALGRHRGAHHPTGRPGAQQAHGLAADVLGGHDAAGRLHDQQGPPVARLS